MLAAALLISTGMLGSAAASVAHDGSTNDPPPLPPPQAAPQPRRPSGYVRYPGEIRPVLASPRPHSYLREQDLPAVWDWRNINGTNLCGHTYSQETPNHCGSCWAEAATGALSDRYVIATGGRLRVSLSPQTLLNFKAHATGGDCDGGDHVQAYAFAHRYGLADDTCAAKVGLDRIHSYYVSALTDVEDVRAHECFECEWTGPCGFVNATDYNVNLYGVDEFGTLSGVAEMKAEIYARGPIACLINSGPPEFDGYRGGVIRCPEHAHACNKPDYTDHVVVVAGWGVDQATGTPFWVGRNSYGTKWGEGAGGGWFRLELGKNVLNMESNNCSFAVPAASDVQRAVDQFEESLGLVVSRR
jgi:cathepsin X